MAVPRTTVIPTELCSYALKDGFVRQFQVFLYLKFLCSGKIRLGESDIENIRIVLGLKSRRTIKNCLKDLEKKNWMSYSKRSGYYFIKGFDKIRQLHGFYRRGGAEFSFEDIKSFKEFLTAVIIGSLINIQKSRLWAVECLKGRSKTPARRHSSFYPIANEALSKILKISLSTAFAWKRASQKQGYILIKKDFEILKGIKPLWLKEFKKYGDKPAHKVRYSKHQIFLQKPDLVYSEIHFKRRKKLIKPEI